MKETRSLKTRNRAGAFCGGLLGILGAGFIHPALIPVGVILGVLGGFYSQEVAAVICREVTSYINRIITFCRQVMEISITAYEAVCTGLQFIKADAVKTWSETTALSHWFGRLVPVRPSSPIAHPMTKAYATHGLAVIAFLLVQIGILTLAWPALAWYQQKASYYNHHGNPLIGIPVILGSLLMICWGVVMLVSTLDPYSISIDHSPSGKMRSYYLQYEEYSRSAFSYFLRRFIHRLKVQAVMTLWMTLLFAYGVVGGLLWLAALTPVAIFVGSVRSMYRLARQPDHWPCLVTTLTVTFVSAGIFHAHFSSAVFLWMVALGTGVASGAATEMVQNAMNTSVQVSEWLAVQATKPFGSHLQLANRMFVRGIGLINIIPARTIDWA